MKFNIVNEIKLTYSRKGNSEKLVGSSKDAVDVFRQHFDRDEMDYRESFFALYLNQAHKVLGIRKISESGISSTVVDVRIIMQAALLCNASAIILAHNHPSGNLKPSAEDLKITQSIKKRIRIFKSKITGSFHFDIHRSFIICRRRSFVNECI